MKEIIVYDCTDVEDMLRVLRHIIKRIKSAILREKIFNVKDRKTINLFRVKVIESHDGFAVCYFSDIEKSIRSDHLISHYGGYIKENFIKINRSTYINPLYLEKIEDSEVYISGMGHYPISAYYMKKIRANYRAGRGIGRVLEERE